MAQTAANLIDHVVPQDVALRQWVLTFPFEQRARLGFDAELLSELCGVVNNALLRFYERSLRERVEPLQTIDEDTPKRRRKLQSGTVTVVQRTSSDLRLNPHLHILALDGAFAEQPDGPPRFVQLPTLASIDVAELLVTIRTQLLRLLATRGVIDTTQDLTLLPWDEAERDPIHLVHAASTTITGPLCATDSGFSLHAATGVSRDNPRGKQALVRYVLPTRGLTLFADGVELYKRLSPELRKRIEGRNVVYTLDLAYSRMRFGRPKRLREIKVRPGQAETVEYAKKLPRAVHPAVWTRATGEKVLHVSPWMSVGIEGQESPEGDALLEALCQEVADKANPYAHAWKTSEMLIWDNWRMLHAVSGLDPKYPRRMQRTTIKGDYGLGYFENNGVGDAILEMTV